MRDQDGRSQPKFRDALKRGASVVSFGDNVRISVTKETEDAGVAGLLGQVFGETTPSISGVTAIGALARDYAINVHFEAIGKSYWFADELVELVDHGEGTEIRLKGIDKQWTKTKDGSWREDPLAEKTSPWWKFW